MIRGLFSRLIMLSLFFIPLIAQAATIKIDIDRKIGDIDPRIYGVFMEPIHFDPADFVEKFCFLKTPCMALSIILIPRMPMKTASTRIS